MLALLAMVAVVTAQPSHIELESRIVNGVPISASNYPWMVSLRQSIEIVKDVDYSDHLLCGGSLIYNSPLIVLTAAHCREDLDFDESLNQFTITFSDINRTYNMSLWADINRTYPEDQVNLQMRKL